MKVIELDPVDILSTDEIFVYSNFSKKHYDNKVNGLGPSGNKSIAIISGFSNPEKSSIQLEGLEFFFNYDWDQDSSGFYIQPVVVEENNGIPNSTYIDFPKKYLVTSKLINRLYIDISSKGINLLPNQRLYIGFKFLKNVNPEIPNSFNVTFTNGRIKENTYLLYSDGRRPELIIGSGKNSAGLKYSVVYKLKE